MQSTVIHGPWAAPAPSIAPPPPAGPPRSRERRKFASAPAPEVMRAGLTPPQRVTLEALEIFRWRLGFVRRPLFQAPVPVLFDQEDTRYVVIREDGTLDEQPTITLRG